MEWFADPHAWIALATLTVLEIVLGIDNIVFISILAATAAGGSSGRERGASGSLLAMVMRIALLFSLTWIMRLTEPLFGRVRATASPGADLILIARRALPDRQEHARDPRQARGRATSHAAKNGTATFASVVISRSPCSTSSSRSTR